jgi:hypothetical protein
MSTRPHFPLVPAGTTTGPCFHCNREQPAVGPSVSHAGYPPGAGEFVTAPCPDCGKRTWFDREPESDGFEDQAIRLGKAQFFSLWIREDQTTLGLSISEQLNDVLGYEAADWGVEVKRRSAKAARVF